MTNFSREVNLSKNIYLFITFIVLVLYIFFNVISVNLKKYKNTNTKIKKIKSQFVVQNNNYNDFLDKYNKKTRENASALKSIVNIYNEIELSRLLSQYFTTFDILHKDSYQKQNYIVSEIQVNSVTTNPQNFYIFISNLAKLNNLVEISYPIKIESNNGYLKIEFALKIYTFE